MNKRILLEVAVASAADAETAAAPAPTGWNSMPPWKSMA